MAWPTTNATKTHLDSSTDDPSQARAELADLVDKVNLMIGASGIADGVCDLDSSGEIPDGRYKGSALASNIDISGMTTSSDAVDLSSDKVIIYDSSASANRAISPSLLSSNPLTMVKRSTTQAIAYNTWTKVQLDSETVDTNSDFDSTTNYRFQPSVAGYYNISAMVNMGYIASASGVVRVAIYKNGALAHQNVLQYDPVTGVSVRIAFNCLVSCNGSSDYIELYALNGYDSTGTVTIGSDTFMHAHFVRAL